jgi:hypothetical protein
VTLPTSAAQDGKIVGMQLALPTDWSVTVRPADCNQIVPRGNFRVVQFTISMGQNANPGSSSTFGATDGLLVAPALFVEWRALAISSAANSPASTFPLSVATASTGSARRRSRNSTIASASSASNRAICLSTSTIRSSNATSRGPGSPVGAAVVMDRT